MKIPFQTTKWLFSKFWTGDTWNTGLASCYLTKQGSTTLLNMQKTIGVR